MNGQMIDSMRQALAAVREREEQCRDVALSIQRLLEAEGAISPDQGRAEPRVERPGAALDAALAECQRTAARKAKETTEKNPPKAAKAERQDKAVKMSRVCPHCGRTYLAKRKDQTNCLADACKVAAKDAWKAKAARAAATPETGIEPAGSPSRLERIKALAGGGEVANG
jgi:hypothetical protein